MGQTQKTETITIVAPGTIDERALGVEWQDGAKTYRCIVPVVTVSDNVTIEVVSAYAVRQKMVKKGLNSLHDLTPTGAEEILANWQDVLEIAGNR